MPKIMFRPAPSPPPFVPPTPSYDTLIEAVSPYEDFSDEYGLYIKFKQASLPPFDEFFIYKDDTICASGLTSDFSTTDYKELVAHGYHTIPFNGLIKFSKFNAQSQPEEVWRAQIQITLEQ